MPETFLNVQVKVRSQILRCDQYGPKKSPKPEKPRKCRQGNLPSCDTFPQRVKSETSGSSVLVAVIGHVGSIIAGEEQPKNIPRTGPAWKCPQEIVQAVETFFSVQI